MFRSLFDPNSAFFRGMERVWTLVVLNVLWVLCSLPVVTIGPSTAALYQVLDRDLGPVDIVLVARGITPRLKSTKLAPTLQKLLQDAGLLQ